MQKGTVKRTGPSKPKLRNMYTFPVRDFTKKQKGSVINHKKLKIMKDTQINGIELQL